MGAPEIDIRLGWFCPNICAADIRRSLAFYLLLGFEQTGGNPADNWATLRLGPSELHLFQGYISENLLHWRGGDIEVIAELARLQGIEAETAAARHPDGAWTLTLRDPAGNGIFLNTFPDEGLRFRAGERASIPGLTAWAGEAGAGMEWQLATPEPQALADWYGLLGMESGPGPAPGSLLLSQGDTRLALDSGLACNRIIVRTGSEGALQACLQRLEARGHDVDSGVLHDPDGNEVVLSDQ